MRNALGRMSPALLVSILALVLALGGVAVGFTLGKNSVRSKNIAPDQVRARDLAPVKLRTGNLGSTDPIAGDGQFTEVEGSARCKTGEQLLSGGVRFHGSPALSQPPRAAVLDSGPVVRPQGWEVRITSDLGGQTRNRFSVFAYCLIR